MINKNTAIKLLRTFNDAIISFNNNREPICATTDFRNKYIRQVRRTERFSLKGRILIFNWTDFKFEAIDINTLINIAPLSGVLNNKGVE